MLHRKCTLQPLAAVVAENAGRERMLPGRSRLSGRDADDVRWPNPTAMSVALSEPSATLAPVIVPSARSAPRRLASLTLAPVMASFLTLRAGDRVLLQLLGADRVLRQLAGRERGAGTEGEEQGQIGDDGGVVRPIQASRSLSIRGRAAYPPSGSASRPRRSSWSRHRAASPCRSCNRISSPVSSPA